MIKIRSKEEYNASDPVTGLQTNFSYPDPESGQESEPESDPEYDQEPEPDP